jgi:hypothetical protein
MRHIYVEALIVSLQAAMIVRRDCVVYPWLYARGLPLVDGKLLPDSVTGLCIVGDKIPSYMFHD